ncbi:GntR family transcriptional regulator [Vibrio ruber]|uniref:GntR family transcriptional regulator n=1 Tax=Vibrio ruber TaxID=184755 RepID=UPI0028933557|nr:GntR family transcriptional regulator [Vibrio ruber]WNJ94607.1 GntR family transcriptional regulator [Vibrio ruber]
MSVSLDTRLARYLQISDQLHQRILNGEWQPGDAIPAESQLSTEYGVALGTMRKAIQQLMKNGLLERRHGVGTFVRRADFNMSLFRFFRFSDDSGERIIPEGKILDIQKAKPCTEIAAKLRLPPDSSAVHINRLRIWKGNPVLIEDIWLPLPKFEPLLAISPTEFPNLLYPFYETLCGAAIVSAKEELMVEKVSTENAQALGLQTGEPVIVIERTTVDISGNTVEWRSSRGAAEKFRYQINIF